MNNKSYYIDGYHLTIDDIISVAKGERGKVYMSPEAIAKCQGSRNQINKWLEKDAPVIYGVNTGLGNLKDTVLSPEDHLKWNKTIPYPHAVGMGAPIDPDITRISLLIRANVLCRSYSAVRPELIQRMLDIFNAQISPVVLELGSTGLSDLGPLAQSAMVVAGLEEAEAFYKGKRDKAQNCFIEAGLAPVFELECKEVLAQMNGSTMTQAIAVLTCYTIEKLISIQKEIESAIESDEDYFIDSKEKVYSANDAALKFVSDIINFENNITCDNPHLFQVEGERYEPVMGCNCSNTQVGYVLDLLNILLFDRSSFAYELISLMEKKDHRMAGVRNLSRTLLQEIKTLCMPASADSISTKGNQEDHVEFSYGAARKAIKATTLFKSLLSCQLYAILHTVSKDKAHKQPDILHQVGKHLDSIDNEIRPMEKLEMIEKYIEKHFLLNHSTS